MRIKRVEADTVAEALRELRRELGEHALILHTRQLPPRGVTGWFRSARVEVLGAVDEPELLRAPAARSDAGASAFARMQQEAAARLQGATSAGVGAEPARAPASREAQRQAVAERLARFRAVTPTLPLGTTPAPAGRRDGAVRDAGGRPTGGDTATPAPGPPVEAGLGGVRFAGDARDPGVRPARRVAFVGPTGAGKTTTLAKLAARAQLDEGRRVGLVTIDTYRIGAVPQLAAYAEILRVPLEVAHTAEELARALGRLADREVVFIDTIGRSPLGGGVDALVPFLAVASADEVHLVLAATTRPADSIRAAASFARLAPNRLVITKLDETEDHSAVVEVARATGLPLAWFGVGQEVPDDLEPATAERLGGLLAGGGR